MTGSGLAVLSIYVDASPRIGYGHVNRCMTIAETIRAENRLGVSFLTSTDLVRQEAEDRGFAVHIGERSGFHVAAIETLLQPGDGPLLLDTYEVDEDALARLHENAYWVAVMEDGKRLPAYPCQMVIDSALDSAARGYLGLADTQFLLGGEYYPVRRKFQDARRTECRRECERLVVAFGGADEEDMSRRVVELMGQLQPLTADLMLGPGYAGGVSDAQSSSRLKIHRNSDEVERILGAADLALSAAGSTAMDLAYLGVPSILVTVSDDQIAVAAALEDAGAAICLGSAADVQDAEIVSAVRALAEDRNRREQMSANGRRRLDGRGAKRIANAIAEAWSSRSGHGSPEGGATAGIGGTRSLV